MNVYAFSRHVQEYQGREQGALEDNRVQARVYEDDYYYDGGYHAFAAAHRQVFVA